MNHQNNQRPIYTRKEMIETMYVWFAIGAVHGIALWLGFHQIMDSLR